MDISNKNARQLLNALLLFSACCCVSTAQGDDGQPVDIPSPLDIAPTSPSLPDTLSLSSTMSVKAAPPASMRFVTLGRVKFASNKWELSDAAKLTLNAVSGYLASNPGASRLLLDGHTDWVGGLKFNDKLSDKRATAVEAYLVNKGIDPTLIHWKGYGKRTPIDENWTRLGRDRNRQVELYAVFPSLP
jgi:outer membrane protein OmpA-like peptidoglycan-associated protein